MDWLFRYADPSIDWGYAMVTLLVRFIGVFIVMFVMQMALQAASFVVGRIERRGEEPDAVPATVTAGTTSTAPAEAGVGDATLAAIGLALALESRAGATGPPGGTSQWGIAGRVQQLNRVPRG